MIALTFMVRRRFRVEEFRSGHAGPLADLEPEALEAAFQGLPLAGAAAIFRAFFTSSS